MNRGAVRAALAAATEHLLAWRTSQGHWAGELSSSALSTAVAAFALSLHDPAADEGLIRRGLEWVARRQNSDGGWGDTTLSKSNLSTTVLCWSAMSAAGASDECRGVLAAAEAYVARRAGSVCPGDLAPAVARRYGADRTFSAPILAMCALAGRLGGGPQAWRHIPRLPFELAACPHGLLKALRLPVVSYALPALIAVGQLGHHHRPPANPLVRWLRDLVRRRTLAVLDRIQPASGGFLEAPPLTGFVLMSLAGVGQGRSPAAGRCAEFLRGSIRPDGSWPIDTNLATWVTTLAVNALSGPATAAALGDSARGAIRDWLLAQQHRRQHHYTHAAPGGWAWTDLAGGVPDADDTAGAVRALRMLAPGSPAALHAAAAGCQWLAGLQNRDGGIPTFCRGWGRLPFDRSCPDLTAHALLAWMGDGRSDSGPAKGPTVGPTRGFTKAIRYLARSQRPDGSWAPLWFGNEDAPDEENLTYGTARVVMALARLAPGRLRRHPFGPSTQACGELSRAAGSPAGGALGRAVGWLLAAQGPDGGWGGAPGLPASIEETAIATDALAGVLIGLSAAPLGASGQEEAVRSAVAAGANWLIDRTSGGREFPPAPIGLYFARLWYFERLYPVIFAVSALSRAEEALGDASGR